MDKKGVRRPDHPQENMLFVQVIEIGSEVNFDGVTDTLVLIYIYMVITKNQG